jgi:hypothetical protein
MTKSVSSNWINKVNKTYAGPIRDISKDVRIAYDSQNGKREIIYVNPDRVPVKIQSLSEKGLNPKVLP